MTFRITTTPRVRAPVKLSIEVDGTIEEHEFGATFRILPVSRASGEAMRSDEGQLAFLTEAITGFDDLVDDDGKPTPFTPALVAAMLDRVEIRPALIKAYFEAAQKAAAGN